MPYPPYVATMRRFNRFYTRQIGLLDEGLLNSPFSLTQVRTLYELAQREQTTAVELCSSLGLDASYLSRMLAAFEKAGLIEKRNSPTDPPNALAPDEERPQSLRTPQCPLERPGRHYA